MRVLGGVYVGGQRADGEGQRALPNMCVAYGVDACLSSLGSMENAAGTALRSSDTPWL